MPNENKKKLGFRDGLLVLIDNSQIYKKVSKNPLITLFIVLSILVSLAISALFFVKLDRIVVGRGQTISNAPKYAIKPLNQSVVKEVLVHVGQIVHRGDPLVTLDPTTTEADVRKLIDNLKSYEAETKRLLAHVNEVNVYPNIDNNDEDSLLQKANFESERQQYTSMLRKYDEKILELSVSISELGNKESFLVRQAEAAKKTFDMWDELVNQHQFGSKISFYKAQSDLMGIEAQLAEVRGTRGKAKHELESSRAEKEAYIKEWKAKKYASLTDVTRDLRDTRQELIKANVEKEMVTITATEEAVVLETGDITVGSVVSPNDALLTLVSAAEPKQIEIQIAGTDVAYVQTGQKVRVKLDALSYQKYGTLDAVVQTISHDSFQSNINRGGKSNRINQGTAVGSMDDGTRAEQFYILRLDITQTNLKNLPESYRLLPGMSLNADINVGHRMLSEYLLFPVLRGLDEGLREPS